MEDYKNLYEEAIERAKDIAIRGKYTKDDAKSACEYIFPQLTQSEGERIKKALIRVLKRYTEGYTNVEAGLSLSDAIAWLEKQGEKKLPEIHIPKFKIGDTIRLKNSFAEYTITDISDGCYHGNGWGLGVIAADESGDYELVEEKPADAITKVYKPKYPEDLEGELVSKKEPKFKVGDFIKHNYYPREIYKVHSITPAGKYELESVDGIDEKNIENATENCLKLWAIEDVNKGDILYSPKYVGVEGICIAGDWENIEGTGKTLCSPCFYRVKEDEIVTGGLGAIWWKGVLVKFRPATKEERELLFKKMGERGYEWDEDTLELKGLKEDSPIEAGSDADYINDLTEYFDGCALCHSEEEIIEWLNSLKNKLSCKETD